MAVVKSSFIAQKLEIKKDEKQKKNVIVVRFANIERL